MGGKGSALRAIAAGVERSCQGADQVEKRWRADPGTAPQDARARPIADAVEPQVEGLTANLLHRRLATGALVGRQLPEEGEGQVQVLGMGQTTTPLRDRVQESGQRGALGLAGPEGEEKPLSHQPLRQA